VNASIQAGYIKDWVCLTKDTIVTDVVAKAAIVSLVVRVAWGWFMMRCIAHVSGQASHASLLAFSIAAVKASEIEFPRWVHKASNGGSVSPKDH
jgi:hypothetical protein